MITNYSEAVGAETYLARSSKWLQSSKLWDHVDAAAYFYLQLVTWTGFHSNYVEWLLEVYFLVELLELPQQIGSRSRLNSPQLGDQEMQVLVWGCVE